MNQTIPKLLRTLYRRLTAREPDEATAAELDLIAGDSGLLESAPDWLIDLFTALVENGSFEDRTLTPEQFFDRSLNITDFFATLAPVLGIDRLHEGEYMVLSVEPLGVSVCFDFETLTGGVDVRLLRWSRGPWPHWERWPEGDPRNGPSESIV